jgi:hypothetical protein
MTTFDFYESSLQGGRPLELYTISVGLEEFRYTSNAVDVTYSSKLYSSIPIRRGEVVAGQSLCAS